MPAVTRKGDNNTGHDACPAVPLITSSSNVFANGKCVGCLGDTYQSHGCIAHASHSGHISSGSSKVFVNGKPIARVGDSVSCGGSVAQGSPNVIAG